MTENKRKNPPRSGFTLIEVMIVLFILVMMGGVALVNIQGQRVMAQKRAALAAVQSLKNAVGLYTSNVGRPPTTDIDQGLAALRSCPSGVSEAKWGDRPYLDPNAKLTDPWDNEYRYSCPGKNGAEFDIWSHGPDGIDGTEDDIGTWTTDI